MATGKPNGEGGEGEGRRRAQPLYDCGSNSSLGDFSSPCTLLLHSLLLFTIASMVSSLIKYVCSNFMDSFGF